MIKNVVNVFWGFFYSFQHIYFAGSVFSWVLEDQKLEDQISEKSESGKWRIEIWRTHFYEVNYIFNWQAVKISWSKLASFCYSLKSYVGLKAIWVNTRKLQKKWFWAKSPDVEF